MNHSLQHNTFNKLLKWDSFCYSGFLCFSATERTIGKPALAIDPPYTCFSKASLPLPLVTAALSQGGESWHRPNSVGGGLRRSKPFLSPLSDKSHFFWRWGCGLGLLLCGTHTVRGLQLDDKWNRDQAPHHWGVVVVHFKMMNNSACNSSHELMSKVDQTSH